MGGLGFRDIRDFNSALLAKQCWKLIQSPTSLVSKIFRSKYFPNGDFFKANLGRNPSYVWKSLVSARFLLQEGGVWRIGDGWDVNIWENSWLPHRPGSRILGPAPADMINSKVGEFVDHSSASWNEDKLHSHFTAEEVSDILKVRLPLLPCSDKLCWPDEKYGEFSVKSGYRCLCGMIHVEPEVTKFYKPLWECILPPKIKHFGWRVSRGILPTASALYDRNILASSQCPVCAEENENISHSLVRCDWATNVWNHMVLPSTPFQFHGDDCIQQWMRWVTTNNDKESLRRGLLLMWMLWNSRNSKVFKDVACNGMEIPFKVEHYLSQYTDVQGSKQKLCIVQNLLWQSPPIDFIKLNCDASFRNNERCGAGAVIRDHERAVLGAMAVPLFPCSSVKEAETIAIKEGLSFARDCGFNKIEVESDAAEVISEIRRNSPSTSLHGHVLDEIRQLVTCFSFCSFKFIPWHCNTVADRLAFIGASKAYPHYWLEEIPPCTANVILNDL